MIVNVKIPYLTLYADCAKEDYVATRLLVTGDRNWGTGKHANEDFDILTYALDEMVEYWGVTDLAEGCARGADRMAEHWALELAPRPLQVHHYPAQWGKYQPVSLQTKNPAGPIRNRQMLKGDPCEHPEGHKDGPPDVVVAFHRTLSTSKGTADMVNIARAAGVPVFVFPHHANGT